MGLLALAAGAASTRAHAQDRSPAIGYIEVGLATARTRGDAGASGEPLHGAVLALAGGASRGNLLLEGRYAQGNLSADSPAVERRDLVEGELRFGMRLLPAITVSAGPHVRAYADSSGTRRWVFWEARVAGTAPLIPTLLSVHAQLWTAVVGSTSLSNEFGSERGGEVGALLRFPKAPLALRLAYRIDRGSGTSPARSDTVEQIVFAVRASLP